MGKKPTTLKKALEKKLTKKQLSLLTTSYDIIGDIAIIEIKDELKSKEKIIGQTILNLHKNINTVCKRAGIHSGKYRRQKLTIIAGKRTKTTIHKENGVRMQLHVQDCYFSPRSATERLRIAKLVKKDESILVMFSGVAPFPLVIAKNAEPKNITAVELNPVAHKFAEINIKLNKFTNIKAIKGDVSDIVPKLKKFDRVVMPLPKTGEHFLPLALKVIKPKGTIHYYDFAHTDAKTALKNKIKTICKKAKKTCTIKKLVHCGQYSPKVFRMCADITVR